jgi:putative transposase
MRVGQKGTLTRVWAATGSRPTALRSDGYKSVYIFGAVCPARRRMPGARPGLRPDPAAL